MKEQNIASLNSIIGVNAKKNIEIIALWCNLKDHNKTSNAMQSLDSMCL